MKEVGSGNPTLDRDVATAGLLVRLQTQKFISYGVDLRHGIKAARKFEVSLKVTCLVASLLQVNLGGK